MNDHFDPYHQWLGIRDPERPPNHYRLLGLELFESNSDVIETAADRQMAHVRTFQGGKNAELSQQILNELSTAKLCLLNPDSRHAYDAKLQIDAPPSISPDAPLDASFTRNKDVREDWDVKIDADESSALNLNRPKRGRRGKRSKIWFAGTLVALLTAAGLGVVAFRPWEFFQDQVAVAENSSGTKTPVTLDGPDDDLPSGTKGTAGGQPVNDGTGTGTGTDGTGTDGTGTDETGTDGTGTDETGTDGTARGPTNSRLGSDERLAPPNGKATGRDETARPASGGSGSNHTSNGESSVRPLQPQKQTTRKTSTTPPKLGGMAPWKQSIKDVERLQIASAGSDVGSFALALSGRDVATARVILESQIETSRLKPAEKSLLESLLNSQETFWATVQHASQNIRQASQISFRGQPVNVISRNPAGIKLLAKNNSSKVFAVTPKQIDPDFAVALALFGLRDSRPTAWRLIGTFLAVDAKGDLAAASKYWQLAKQNGAAAMLDEEAFRWLQEQVSGQAISQSTPSKSDDNASTTVETIEDDEDNRFDLPTRSVVRAAIRNLRRDNPQWFVRSSLDEQRETIQRLFELAHDETNEHNERYAALGQAKLIGLKLLDAETVLRSTLETNRSFKTNLKDELSASVDALREKAKTRRSIDNQISDASIDLAYQSLRQEAFNTAQLLKELASQRATELQRTRISAFEERYDETLAMHDSAQQAQLILASDAKNPTANQQVGFYFCFVKKDFRRGLSYLVKGNSRLLQDLAMADSLVGESRRPNRQLFAAWTKVAESSTGIAKQGMLERARFWASTEPFDSNRFLPQL